MSQEYDAIVIGTGISGGWAAKELCESGLKTLVLERGRMIRHITDYHTANMDPWDFKGGDKTTQEIEKKQYKQIRSTRYAVHESTSHFFVDDDEHPYNEDKPFDWVRGYHVGGKSLMWARQVYRLSEFDFEANAKEGIAIDWPIRYKDLAPWYSYVEEYIGNKYSKLCISFKSPDRFGLTDLDSDVTTAICAEVKDLETDMTIAQLLHYVSDNAIGCSMQSYFWLGNKISHENRILNLCANFFFNFSIVKRYFINDTLAKSLLRHCCEEMNHLSIFLPELYKDISRSSNSS